MMMKSIVLIVLSSVAINAFVAPSTAFGNRRASLARTTNNLIFMSGTVEDKTVDDTKSADNRVEVTALEAQNANFEEKEMSETDKLMQKVKESGTAGIVSYALWELAFWAVSVPVCIFGYYEITG
jgi:uncharacterized protein YggE